MEEDLRSAAETLNDMPNEHKYKPQPSKRYHSKKPLLFLLILVVVAAGGVAVKKFVLDKPKKAPATVATAPVAETKSVDKDVPDTQTLEDYKSTALALEFKHPKTWTVTEAGGGLRVESPEFSYEAAEQGEVTGNFRVYMRKGSRDIDGTYIGRGVAIKDSEKLVYTQPAVGQRTETLLSSFGYDSSDVFSLFLIAGNFQLKKGDTLGPNYGKEPDTYIVAGGYSAKTLVDDLSMNSVDATKYSDTKAYKQGLAIIGSLKLE